MKHQRMHERIMRNIINRLRIKFLLGNKKKKHIHTQAFFLFILDNSKAKFIAKIALLQQLLTTHLWIFQFQWKIVLVFKIALKNFLKRN